MLRFAFLRAINVGGRRVRMDDLRMHFESLGLSGVSTFIASGNVIFESAHRNERTLERRIERHLQKMFGFEVVTFLRSTDELGAIAAHDRASAGSGDPPGTLFVGFMRAAPATDAVQALMRLHTAGDVLDVRGREVYWLRRGSLAESPIAGLDLEKVLRTPITLRNINTVDRLLAKYRR